MNTFKYNLFLNDPWGIHRKVVDLVPAGSSVLEIGCATGFMSQEIARKNCKVTGVEINGEAAKLASKYCQRVLVGDVESLPILTKLQKSRFDVILCTDVLEHLKNPDIFLRELRSLLTSKGRLIVSVPNIAFITNRLNLLLGRFNYAQRGIMDKTHLKFFTKQSINTMIADAGFHIEHFDVVGNFTQLPFYMRTIYSSIGKKLWLRKLEYKLALLWPEGLSVQFLFVCTKTQKSNVYFKKILSLK